MTDARRVYDRIARVYDLLDLPFEHGRYRSLRPALFEGLRGRVLDAGIGTGRNIPYYPRNAAVVGFDLSRAMLAGAARRRARLGADVGLVQMDVCRAAFADHSFDAVVSTFMFCVLDDSLQRPALEELRRICKPAGEIRLLEYAYSADSRRRAIMRLWAPWVHWAYGATFDRETERYMTAAGLDIVETRFLYRDIIKMIVARPRPQNR